VSDYLTTAEIARTLKISVSTATKMARDGKLPALKVGRLWRFPRQSAEILIAKQAQSTRRKQRREAKPEAEKPRHGLKEFVKLAQDFGVIEPLRS
jgi:excisionase family DNA binding protein